MDFVNPREIEEIKEKCFVNMLSIQKSIETFLM